MDSWRSSSKEDSSVVANVFFGRDSCRFYPRYVEPQMVSSHVNLVGKIRTLLLLLFWCRYCTYMLLLLSRSWHTLVCGYCCCCCCACCRSWCCSFNHSLCTYRVRWEWARARRPRTVPSFSAWLCAGAATTTTPPPPGSSPPGGSAPRTAPGAPSPWTRTPRWAPAPSTGASSGEEEQDKCGARA